MTWHHGDASLFVMIDVNRFFSASWDL